MDYYPKLWYKGDRLEKGGCLMKLRKLCAMTLALCVMILAGCGGGDVSEVGRQIGKCDRYTPGQIDAAMDEVEKEFKANYDGCTLLRLSYDEEETLDEAYAWSENYGADAIVLKSDFYVDDSGRMVTMNPDSLYKNWSWILVKTAFGWEIRDCGYG